MSAATLSPTEREEVARFGIHDEDVIADMQEHRDDHVRCFSQRCGADAWWQIIANCCGQAWPMCNDHKAVHRIRCEFILAAGQSPFCKTCSAQLAGQTYDDAFRVVPL